MTEGTFGLHHPPPEALAALARSELSNEGRASQAAHLARCRRCMAIYAGFVEASLESSLSEVRVPSEWKEEALRLQKPTSGNSRTWTRTRALTGSVAAALVVVAVTWFFWGRSPERGSIPSSIQTPLTAQLRADSQGSLLYDADLAPNPRGVRGSASSEEAATASLPHLLELQDEHPSDPEIGYWLVSGYLATNQLRNADPFLRENLSRFPQDARFLNLAAILAYKRNNLEEAETLLRRALVMERDPAILVNLAIVRGQAGDAMESKTLLGEVESRYPDSVLLPYVRDIASQTP